MKINTQTGQDVWNCKTSLEMQDLKDKLNHLLSRLDYAEKQVTDETGGLEAAEHHAIDVENSQVLVQSVAEKVQNVAHKRVAAIVTRCLRAVFGRTYEFKINFRKSRGKTEAELKLTKDGLELDPMDSTGGGVVDVVSFALRLAGLVMSRPAKRKILILDEPFRHLSRNYSERARIMLETLANELGFQLILVTHNPRLKLGKEIQL